MGRLVAPGEDVDPLVQLLSGATATGSGAMAATAVPLPGDMVSTAPGIDGTGAAAG